MTAATTTGGALRGAPAPVHARALSRAGLAIVPTQPLLEDGTCGCRKRRDCKTPGKHPRILWKERPALPPTPEELERWWRVWPDSGVGVILGDQLCALDVDQHEGGADGPAELAALEARHEPLPPTWTASSPHGKGRHLYFANHGRFPSVRKVAPGIQLRCGRHVMVLPPTQGREWIVSPRAPLAELPVWIADVIQRNRKRSRATAPADYVVAERLLPDDRHPAYVRIGLDLARMRFPVPVIAEMLAVVDRLMADPPKGDPEELQAIAKWAVEEVA